MKILSGFSGTVDALTKVVISLLALGIVVSLLGGNVPFVGAIADNIVGYTRFFLVIKNSIIAPIRTINLKSITDSDSIPAGKTIILAIKAANVE